MYNLRVDRISEDEKVCYLVFDFNFDMIETMYSILFQHREIWKGCNYVLYENNEIYENGEI